jgi:hypothetical protein
MLPFDRCCEKPSTRPSGLIQDEEEISALSLAHLPALRIPEARQKFLNIWIVTEPVQSDVTDFQ